MSEKIQKNVITLLAVILVVVSLVSTFVFLGKVTIEPQSTKIGEIRLEILGSPSPPDLPQTVENKGEISLTVLQSEES